jgi:L-asparaginase
MLLKMKYRGVVLETFGAGGINITHGSFLSKIKMLVDNGVAIAAVSQCTYEPSDFSIYEVGTKLMSCGVIPGMDMTTEAVVTKLMWALGQTDSIDEVRRIFNTCYAGEVTLPVR